jgi:adenylate cyclase
MGRLLPPEPLVRPPLRRVLGRTVAAGLGLTLAIVALARLPLRTLESLEGKVYDIFLRAAPHRPAGAVPVVVDIDEESLARYGQWPWPRYRVAQLLERVAALGASAVGVDLLFAEPDRTSLAVVAAEMERDLAVSIALEGVAGAAGDNDRRLAQALAQGPFVLGYAFDFTGAAAVGRCELHPVAAGAPPPGGAAPGIIRAPGVACNLPELARAAGASGFFNVAPDADGIIRRVPLLIEHRGALYPSLALATLLRARGERTVAFEVSGGAVARLAAAGRTIPVDGRGAMLVRFRGAGHGYRYLSAAAVLEGRVPAGSLAGCIALVGSTAAGLKELRATPLDPVFPGPEVHAAAVDTILQGDFLRRPRVARGAELLAALALGALATLVLSRSGAVAALPLLIGGSGALWGGAFWLFAGPGLFVSPLVPQAALAATFALLSFLRFRQSEREAAEFSRKLALTQDVIIQSMAALAETRDSGTGGHIQRTRHYVRLLAEKLRGHPRFRDFLDEQTIELLYKLAPLHDIGKVGVRDHVLLKPERLTREEFDEMKRHTIYGDDTLEIAERRLGDDSFLRIAREFALTHQEKWDGTGYPQGLSGEQIPIAGRLMAVADVYDALVSRRKYKEPLTHDAAAAILRDGRGTHFDPDVLDAFIEHQEEFRQIAARFADNGGRP